MDKATNILHRSKCAAAHITAIIIMIPLVNSGHVTQHSAIWNIVTSLRLR